MKSIATHTALAVCLTLAAFVAQAEGRFAARGSVPTPEGGSATGAVTGAKGPNGGATVGTRGVVQNPDGSTTAASGRAVKTPAGGYGARVGQTQVNADGSATHQSGAGFTGPKGSGSTQGTASRDGAGNATGARQSNVNTSQGNYQGDTSVNKTGSDVSVNHNGTCTNSAGQVVTCPKP